MGNLQQAIDQNKFRQAVYEILKKNGVVSGNGPLPNDQNLLEDISKLGKTHTIVNAVLKSGQGIRIDKYDNGKAYKISANGNGEFGADITNQSLGLDIAKSDPTNVVVKKLIDAVDTAKKTAIKAPVIHSMKTIKANQTGEIPWTYDGRSGIHSGLTPLGWYLSLQLESQVEPMLVDLTAALGDVYRSAVQAARNDMQVLIQKTMEQHLKQYHSGVPGNGVLPNIPDPFDPHPQPNNPGNGNQNGGGNNQPVPPTPAPDSDTCPAPDAFLNEIKDILKP